jgi:hypothetical protein
MSRSSQRLAWAVALGLTLLLAWTADAASKRTSAHPKAKAKPTPRCGAAAKEEPISVAGAKVAMFAFSGDDVEPVQRQVQRLFRVKGIKVNRGLRPVDSAEQYREMAVTLNLIAYVDGEVSIDGAEASATIFIRSGTTGLRIASATFSGDRRLLASSVGKELWAEVGPALGRAFADTAKPRRVDREPMRINAGTPLTDGPDETD